MDTDEMHIEKARWKLQKNAARFYGILYTEEPLLADSKVLHQICADTRFRLGGLTGEMGDKDRWLKRLMELRALKVNLSLSLLLYKLFKIDR